ncbi:hypothetical protein ACFL3V_06840 [Nanoarchaeota archaeon]
MMAGPAYLTVTLKLMALYAGVMGSLALIFQDVGSVVLGYNVVDTVPTRYWGAMLLVMAIFYLFLSSDPLQYRLFIWIGVLDLGVAMLLSIYLIATNVITWLNGVTAVVLNPIFIIILLLGLAKEQEGHTIIREHQEGERHRREQLPEHAVGKHPLHNK